MKMPNHTKPIIIAALVLALFASALSLFILNRVLVADYADERQALYQSRVDECRYDILMANKPWCVTFNGINCKSHGGFTSCVITGSNPPEPTLDIKCRNDTVSNFEIKHCYDNTEYPTLFAVLQ